MISNQNVSPYSEDAEANVVSSIIESDDCWTLVEGILIPSDFYVEKHRLIFEAVKELHRQDRKVDILTVTDYLESTQKLSLVGGKEYIAFLLMNSVGHSNILAYAKIVQDRSIKRKLIALGARISNSVYTAEDKAWGELLDEAEREVALIAEERDKSGAGLVSLEKILPDALNRLEEIVQSKNGITGLSTGLSDFDELTSGLQNGDMIVIAGRPSMGKTTLAMNIVESVAMNTGGTVAVFSLEMPKEQLANRMMASIGKIDQTMLRQGILDSLTQKKLAGAVKTMRNLKIFIDDQGGLSPSEVRTRARKLKRESKDLKLVMVDYLQLMSIPGMGENRVGEVSEISRMMKIMARELNVPVVVLSQLNRGVESRKDKRPMISDLRESGAIEQDADLIAFVYRDEVYHSDTLEKGVAEIIIGKQRNGPIGTVKTHFDGKCSRFANLAAPYMDNVRE